MRSSGRGDGRIPARGSGGGTAGAGTRLPIRVKAPEEQHTVTVGKVLSWPEGEARCPSEKLKKSQLRDRLRS